MELCKIKELLKCTVLNDNSDLAMEVKKICASELMSNVLTCTGANTLLITGLNNMQVVRTAEMSDIPAVIFIQDRTPSSEVIKLAREKGIVIMVTEYSLFTACGILYEAGMRCGLDQGC
ncbi:MAG: DRTGG domain-containing protein [Peptococcaceae bacterium]